MTIFAWMLIIAGVLMAAAPDLVYDLTQRWKNGKETEPSDVYRIMTRIHGGLFVVVGMILIIR